MELTQHSPVGLHFQTPRRVGKFLKPISLAVFIFCAIEASLPIARAQNPVPLIYLPLVPTSAAPGGAAFTLTVNGTGFVSGATVDWNGAPLSTTFVSGSQLKAAVPASDIASAATVTVTVVNPTPGGGSSNPDFFQISYPTSSVTFKESPSSVSITGAHPFAVVVADFNGDGKQDLAVIREADTTVNILLGNGDGSFQSPVSYVFESPALGDAPICLVASDFNDDGKMDLAISHSGLVSILLGNGDGTFQPHVDYALPIDVTFSQMVAVDLNGDGHIDLAGQGTLTFLLGNGDGTFHTVYGPLVPNVTGNGFIVADFNRDGKFDLATTELPEPNIGNNNSISIMFGNGDGTYQPPAQYQINSGTIEDSMIAADFNGDGTLDLAVSIDSNTFKSSGGYLSVLLMNGDDTIASLASDNLGFGSETAVAGDFNSDGKLDLALIYRNGGRVAILLGNGDGTFAPPVFFSFPPTVTLDQMALGDFNGDGKLDLAIADEYQDKIHILLQVAATSFSSNSLNFGNQLVGATSSAETVILTNNNSTALNISSIVASGDYALTTTPTSCPYMGGSVAAAGTCTIDVTFSPTAVGTRLGTVTVTDDGSPKTQMISLSGNGVTGTGSGPSVTISPSSLSFGNRNVGTTGPPKSVTLTNSGNVALTIFLTQTTDGFNETSGCASSLAPQTSCTINVFFAPTVSGSYLGALTITDNAPNSPQIVVLTGTGATLAVTLSPTSLSFGNQAVGTTGPPQNINLTNNGNVPLIISSVSTTSNFGETNQCPSSVAPQTSCTIAVAFAPTASGSMTGTLTILDNAPNSPQTVALTGTGISPAVTLSPTSLTFGKQNVGSTSAAETITLTNNGGAALTVSGIAVTGDFAQTNTCGSSVAAGTNCTITVTFSPTAQGARTGILTITDNSNGVAGSTQTVALSGSGTGPAVNLAPASVTFSGQLVNSTSAAQSVTLTNSGAATLTVAGIVAGGDYAQTNTCGSSVAAGASCTISVTFSPTAAGSRAGTLTITDNGVGSPQTVTLSGMGTDFNVETAPGSSAAATVTAGGTANFNLSFSGTAGFNGAVELTCSGAPALASCSITPSSLTLSGTTPTNTTVSVTTTARGIIPPQTELRPLPPGSHKGLPLLVLVFALTLVGLSLRDRRGRTLLGPRIGLACALLFSLILGAVSLPGCGGGSSATGITQTGTPAGTYLLNVTGTITSGATTLTHNLQLTLTVN
ncbi:MAG TPA: choice-of-anchor D domain-containing protein [Terriglobia bacterium]|nr:choice-of-anchor D domain-containing protein [Terriglobia bacterium]